MTAEFKKLDESLRQIMVINFSDTKEYKKFVEDISQCILMDWDFMKEFTEDIALEISQRYLEKLSVEILDRLIEEKIKRENSRQQENA